MVKYNKEFKEEALMLSDEIGIKRAAEQLGLSYYTLADWRKLRKRAKSNSVSDSTEVSRRMKELEQENAELRRANEILKDALGFSQKTGRSKGQRTSCVRVQLSLQISC